MANLQLKVKDNRIDYLDVEKVVFKGFSNDTWAEFLEKKGALGVLSTWNTGNDVFSFPYDTDRLIATVAHHTGKEPNILIIYTEQNITADHYWKYITISNFSGVKAIKGYCYDGGTLKAYDLVQQYLNDSNFSFPFKPGDPSFCYKQGEYKFVALALPN